MIGQFKSLSFINLFVLFFLVFTLRIGLYVQLPENINTGFSELANRLLISQDNLLTPFTNITLAGLVVFVQALWFNRIVNNFNIIGKSTFLPALVYVVSSSIFTPFLFLSPPLVCNFFLLFILYRILSSVKDTAFVAIMFDLGLATAVATIFYFPFIGMILLLWIVLLIFRPFNWREWISILIGYFTIIFLLGVYYYWNDKLAAFYAIWTPLTEAFPIFVKIQLQDYIVLLPISIGLLLGFYHLRENFFKSFVQVRKTFQLLFFVFIIATFTFYLKPDYRINHFHLAVISVSTLLAYYFLHANKKWFYEPLFLCIIGFIVYFQFV
ncbi:DUF6427 family protein [Pedobacter glucosidilyticus]|uniref:DUF6427 family protein n=1 Tax=Pedobacter glucosidilyticus TaxID=1122941 RepID=UPI0004120841|nr:DUF6427 family protein [Pedobacter glucosidilyticus]